MTLMSDVLARKAGSPTGIVGMIVSGGGSTVTGTVGANGPVEVTVDAYFSGASASTLNINGVAINGNLSSSSSGTAHVTFYAAANSTYTVSIGSGAAVANAIISQRKVD